MIVAANRVWVSLVLAITATSATHPAESLGQATASPSRRPAVSLQESVEVKGSPDALGTGVTSLIRLIATPERYHGKSVTVRGYLHVRFEDCALYLFPAGGSENALWVSFLEKPRPILGVFGVRLKPESFDSRYVVLTGIFDQSEHGHMSAYSGGLREVDWPR